MPREQKGSACMMLTKDVHRIYCCTLGTTLGVNSICRALTRVAQIHSSSILINIVFYNYVCRIDFHALLMDNFEHRVLRA